jgi:hypothetical protein
MLKRKRLTDKQIENQKKYYGLESVSMECSKCSRVVWNLPADVSSVQCCYCVLATVEAPDSIKKQPEEKRSRGWQFKKHYVSPSGKVYSYGEEVVDAKLSNKGRVSK